MKYIEKIKLEVNDTIRTNSLENEGVNLVFILELYTS